VKKPVLIAAILLASFVVVVGVVLGVYLLKASPYQYGYQVNGSSTFAFTLFKGEAFQGKLAVDTGEGVVVVDSKDGAGKYDYGLKDSGRVTAGHSYSFSLNCENSGTTFYAKVGLAGKAILWSNQETDSR
jgi:hypothetical protein